MKCPICGTRRRRNASECPVCGTSYALLDHYYTPYHDSPSPLLYILCWGLAIAAVFVLLGYCVYTVFSSLLSPIREPAAGPQPIPAQTADTEPTTARPAAAEGCFSIQDGSVTFLSDCWDGSTVLTVPNTVDGRPVTALAPGCFRDCTGLTTILLPDTLTAIGAEAFSGCSRLRGLLLPQGMASVGENAFCGCIAMEAICIPATVTSLPSGCFDDCASLLYINYEGDFQSWAALYPDFITPFTIAICSDGSYYHGVTE